MSFVTDAVGSLLGTTQASDAAQEAGDLQYRASQDAIAEQRRQFDLLRESLQPYLQAGQGALGGLQGILGLGGNDPTGLGQYLKTPFQFDPSNLENTPGYQFTLQQGLKALNNQASAQGLGLSGAQQKGLLDYATGLANQTYGDQYNRALQQFMTNYSMASDASGRLASLAGLGQSSAAGVGNAGMNMANSVGSLLGAGATAQGQGVIAQGNQGGNTLGSLLGAGGALAGIYSSMGGLSGLTGLMALSDVREKEDAEIIGKTPGGHTLYRYRYKGSPTKHVGVMAQEVEQVDPDAVVEIDGVKHVDYSKVH